ncbi:hypothetical protein KCU81_g9228, partial [Aureobasidium melanogenum]|uniref:RBR-type E3 ubiquitin transferase n=1 Tax=Aureobasidium melanogenum (strain CBS 110374) TaxID=1043003 RepID=A0A074W660_AURM1
MAHLYGDIDPKTAAFILQLQRDELQAALSEGTAHDKVALQLQLEELNLIEPAHNETTEQQTTLNRRAREPADSGIASLFSGLFAAGQSIYQALIRPALRDCTIPVDNLNNDQIDDNQPESPFTCVAYAKLVLDPKLIRNFEHKSIELDTKDRTYCFDPRCSTFIPTEHITVDIAGCPGCGKRTCAICKAAAHRGDCPRDENLQLLLQAAEAQGWQRCYQCRRLVELRSGCNHMICPCGAHFCYVCGASWNPRACRCPQWDETRLQERAEQIFARDPRHRLFRPPQGALDPGVDAAAAVPPVIPQENVDRGQPANPVPAWIEYGRQLRAEVDPPARPAAAANIEPARVAHADVARQIERLPARNVPVARLATRDDPIVPVPVFRNAYIPPEARRAAIPAPMSMPIRAGRPAAQDAVAVHQQRLVAQIREDLRRNHECDHERWTCHRGRHRCEECNHMLPHYIFECRQCHIRACQRCRRNRL